MKSTFSNAQGIASIKFYFRKSINKAAQWNQRELTCGLVCSVYVLAETGVETEGDRFDAGVTGREVHLFHAASDMEAILELSADVLGSELRRQLRSPSAPFAFLLKLKARKKPLDDLEKL